jgi:peptidoglycan LD-endopeptidase CwlK
MNIAVLSPRNLNLDRLERLVEPAKSKAIAMIAEANAMGIDVCVVATERTIKEQNLLFAQGRTRPGKKVTNARGGDSIHNYRLAWDLCPVVNGRLDWNNTQLFNRLGAIGERHGIAWGGHFKSIVDKPHFQFTAGLTLRDLKNGKRPFAAASITDHQGKESAPAIKELTVDKPVSKQTGGTAKKSNSKDGAKLKTHEIIIEANGASFGEEEKKIMEARGGFKLYISSDKKKLSCQGEEPDLQKIQKVALERGWSAAIYKL